MVEQTQHSRPDQPNILYILADGLGGRRTTALFVAKNVTGDFNIRRLPASDDAQITKVFGRDFSQGPGDPVTIRLGQIGSLGHRS